MVFREIGFDMCANIVLPAQWQSGRQAYRESPYLLFVSNFCPSGTFVLVLSRTKFPNFRNQESTGSVCAMRLGIEGHLLCQRHHK